MSKLSNLALRPARPARGTTDPISDSSSVRSADQEREVLLVTSDEKGPLPIARRRKR